MKCTCNDKNCQSEIHVDTLARTLLIDRPDASILIYIDIPLAEWLIEKMQELIANAEPQTVGTATRAAFGLAPSLEDMTDEERQAWFDGIAPEAF